MSGQFLLTGSQPFEVMAGVTESLAGRADVLQLGTLSYAEILRALPQTPVEDAVVRGGFPEGSGKLALVRRELDPPPPCAIVCRAANRYPIAARIEALPLAELPVFLQDPFP